MEIKRKIFVDGELAGCFKLIKQHGDYWWKIILGDNSDYIRLDVSRDCYFSAIPQPEYQCSVAEAWYIKFREADLKMKAF